MHQSPESQPVVWLTFGKSYCSWWTVLSVLKWYVSLLLVCKYHPNLESDFTVLKKTIQETSQHLPITRFPKVIGILTHVDLIKNSATLKATKKKLYLDRNIPRRQTFPSTVAIQSHKSRISPVHFCHEIPVLSSSETLIHTSSPIESKITPLENSSELFCKKASCDCIVAVYGYLRGTNLRVGTKVTSGVGDLDMNTITFLGDPCPLPTAESHQENMKVLN